MQNLKNTRQRYGRRLIHSDDSARAIKTKAAFRKALARTYADQSLLTGRLIAAGFGNVRPTDMQDRIRLEGDAAPSMFCEYFTLRAEMDALRFAAYARFGSYVEGQISSMALSDALEIYSQPEAA